MYTGVVGRITVRVTPRSSRDAIEGVDPTGVLRVRVTAPPVEGAANAAVAKLLAHALGLAPREVVLAKGERGRLKHFDLPISAEEARHRLQTPDGS